MRFSPALAAALAYAAILARKRALALRYLRTERAVPVADAPFAATIVQPILGGDPELGPILEHNLRALPGVAFLWLVDDDDDDAERVCDALALAHADRDIRILHCAPADERHNPKLHKLALAEAHVRTEIIAVVDDDTMLEPEGYAALVGALARADLTTGLPSYDSHGDLPSALVEQFVDDNATLTYLSACALAPPLTINGMCYALRTKTLAEIGGFAAYARWLPDDLAIARGVRARGGTIYQTPYPHRIRTTVRDYAHYAALMHRWFLFALLLLADVPPRTRAAIGVREGLPPLLLWTALLATLRSRDAGDAAALLALLVCRSLVQVDLQRRTTGASRHRPVVSILAELAQPLHAAHAAGRKTIRWRSRTIVVRAADDFSVVR